MDSINNVKTAGISIEDVDKRQFCISRRGELNSPRHIIAITQKGRMLYAPTQKRHFVLLEARDALSTICIETIKVSTYLYKDYNRGKRT